MKKLFLSLIVSLASFNITGMYFTYELPPQAILKERFATLDLDHFYNHSNLGKSLGNKQMQGIIIFTMIRNSIQQYKSFLNTNNQLDIENFETCIIKTVLKDYDHCLNLLISQGHINNVPSYYQPNTIVKPIGKRIWAYKLSDFRK